MYSKTANDRLAAVLDELVGMESIAEYTAWEEFMRQSAPELLANPDVIKAMANAPLLLTPTAEPAVKQPPVRYDRTGTRTSRSYRLLSTNVEWSTVPQVHALMTILTAHINVGDVVPEEDIVNMMIANEAVLQTRQGGKKIWDYYKGNSDQGLQAHGNVERL